MAGKITNELKSFLEQSQPENTVRVVIELKPVEHDDVEIPATRQQKMQQLRTSFDARLQPVATEIANIGGNIIDTAWINQTISASLPVNSITNIAKLKGVHAIDLPRALSKD